MQLKMYPLTVEVTDCEEVRLMQEIGSDTPPIKITVEQIPFLIELLTIAKSRIEEARYRRISS